MYCASDNHNDRCHTCTKELLDSNLNFKQLLRKMSISNEIVPNLQKSLKLVFWEVS